ncbi:hypothetical protein FNV43_RR14800 [Rhamnella rubrinervis]|uniref:Uncharacterized protein n=1 Tax=Rhamnella rubrinervis TaxID=2594499 RepID=A0A8K0H3K8_9ROSA|nr:hypothetical protein FNV43_RR14800 [Rhamnella rubrinervis]
MNQLQRNPIQPYQSKQASVTTEVKVNPTPGILGPLLVPHVNLTSSSPNLRRITNQEARERHDKGLCYFVMKSLFQGIDLGVKQVVDFPKVEKTSWVDQVQGGGTTRPIGLAWRILTDQNEDPNDSSVQKIKRSFGGGVNVWLEKAPLRNMIVKQQPNINGMEQIPLTRMWNLPQIKAARVSYSYLGEKAKPSLSIPHYNLKQMYSLLCYICTQNPKTNSQPEIKTDLRIGDFFTGITLVLPKASRFFSSFAFRGKFASYLYGALHEKQIITFMDDHKLESGNRWGVMEMHLFNLNIVSSIEWRRCSSHY